MRIYSFVQRIRPPLQPMSMLRVYIPTSPPGYHKPGRRWRAQARPKQLAALSDFTYLGYRARGLEWARNLVLYLPNSYGLHIHRASDSLVPPFGKGCPKNCGCEKGLEFVAPVCKEFCHTTGWSAILTCAICPVLPPMRLRKEGRERGAERRRGLRKPYPRR